MRKFISFLAVGGALLVPFLAVAQGLEDIGVTILRILNIVLLIALALAFLFFVFGVIKYMTGKEAEDKAKARSQMIYGIIGLFVIFSAWGLVRILQRTFGIEGGPGGTTQVGIVYNCSSADLTYMNVSSDYCPTATPTELCVNVGGGNIQFAGCQ